jgi:4-hydroxy-tetrahydrodipicolinate synthase
MQALQGSLVALVTPLDQSGQVDFASLKNLIDWHITQGTNGIVSVGTTGESATLNINEHINVIDFTVRYVDKRVPVIAGTGANSTEEAIELSSESKLKGADYVLLVTPYYNKPNQKGLIAHYESIANKVDIKQLLYNVPSRTACDLLPESVDILSKHPNIIGLKEAVSDKSRVLELIRLSKNNDFLIFSGDDPTFMSSMKLGFDGVISVAANIIPNSISKICEFIKIEEYEDAYSLNDLYKHLYELLFVESNPIPVKWMMAQMGLIQNSIRLPLIDLDKTYHDEVLSELNKLKLL